MYETRVLKNNSMNVFEKTEICNIDYSDNC